MIYFQIPIKKFSFLFILFLFACSTNPEGCGNGFTIINGNCYNQADLDVLQDFIDNSSGSIKSTLDADSSGTIEPLELHIQKWSDKGRLTFLWLYDDSLSGNIPNSIGNLTYLDTLNLSYNQLSGEIPESIGSLMYLNWLYLYSNQLSGKIPDSLCAIYPNLTNTYFSYNQFCPPYPNCIPIEKMQFQDTSNCP